MITKLGEGSLLAKSDIKSAFRLLPISPGDFDLLGFQLEGYFYFDKIVPFGSSISCALWEKLAPSCIGSLNNRQATTTFYTT